MQTQKIDVMTLFTMSLKSRYTKKTYVIELKKFQKYMGAETPDELLKLESDNIIKYITDLAKDDKEAGRSALSYASRKIILGALKHFYDMNDVILNWKKISKFLGEHVKTVEDRGYTREEITKLLSKCDERKRVIVLVFASTGIRVGGMVGLKVKHLKESGDIYKISVYEGTKDKYITYCSHECKLAIDSYLDYRRRHGEKITPDSPLIRNQFNKESEIDAMARVRPISDHMLHVTIYSLLHDSGLREKPTEATSRKRKEIMAIHGFRKFFSTALNEAYHNENPLMVELLLGHDVGLAGVYNKVSEEAKERFYLGGMDALTISEENRLRVRVKTQENIIKESDEMIRWFNENKDRIKLEGV